MKKTLCIFPLIRRISYDGNSISKYFQCKSTTLVPTEPIFLSQRNFSSRKKLEQSNTALKTIRHHIRNKDFGEAFDIYDSCQQRDIALALDDVTALTLTQNLLENNRIADARQIVSDLNQSNLSPISKDATPILHDIITILSTLVDNEEFIWFTDHLIFTRNEAEESLLGYLMNIALNERNDVKLAIQIFTKIITERKKPLWLQVLLIKCITSSNSDDLKTVVHVASSVIGQNNIRFNLAFVYVEVGHIGEAQSVFKTINMNGRSLARIERQIDFRRKKKDKICLANLLAATKSCIPEKYRVRIFEALLLLHINDIDQIQKLCKLMEEENLKPKSEMDEILFSFSKRNIKIPKHWQQPMDKMIADSKISNSLDEKELNTATTTIIDKLQNNKRIQISTLWNIIQGNVLAGNVHEMGLLRAALPEHIKATVDFYSKECRAYINANRHLDYVEIIQWEISNRQAPNLPAVIVDLIRYCPEVYDRLRELINQYDDEDIRLICLLWAHNFITNINLKDNESIWKMYLQSRTSTSVGILSEIFYKQLQFGRLREFLNSNQFEKHRVKPFHLGKAYSYLFEGLLDINDYSTLLIELKLALSFIEVTHLDTNIVKRIKKESADCEAVLCNGMSHPQS